MNYQHQKILGTIGLYLLVAVISLFCLFPFYFAIVTSLKSGTELFSSTLWPAAPSFKNYVAMFTVAEHPFGRHILNSLMVSLIDYTLFLTMEVPLLARNKVLFLALFLAQAAVPQRRGWNRWTATAFVATK